MGISFIIFGLFCWFMATLIKYIFLRPSKVISSNELQEALKINRSENIASSSMQLLGLYWLLLGVIFLLFQIDASNFYLTLLIYAIAYIGPFVIFGRYFEKKEENK